MEEIAATMAAAGLPEGFHQAAAEIYRRFTPAGTAGQEADPGGRWTRVSPGARLAQQGPSRSDR